MRLIERISQKIRFVSAKNVTLVLTLSAMTAISAFNFAYAHKKNVEVYIDGDMVVKADTYAKTVDELLAASQIVLNVGDKVSIPVYQELTDGDVVEVFRAMPVVVTGAGGSKELLTTARISGEILRQLGYAPTRADVISPAFDEEVFAGGEISIVKTSEDVEIAYADVPFGEVKKDNASLLRGQKNLLTEGKNGKREITYKITKHDGVEVSREEVGNQVVEQSVDRVIEVGTKVDPSSYTVAMRGTLPTMASRGEDLKYTKVLQCSATAYWSFGRPARTASGRLAQPGVIAVDPKVIPMNTRMYIEAPDGSWVYGTAVAGDTGGSVKGNIIDLFFNTYEECVRFGRRPATVYILE